MKAIPAIIFASLMAAGLIGSILLMGGNAIFNTDQAPVLNAPASATDPAATTNQQQQIDQLVQQEQLLNQYQAREKQYQTELQQAADRLNQANQQLAQANQQLTQANQAVKMYQNLIMQLQQAGVITITQDGRVLIQ